MKHIKTYDDIKELTTGDLGAAVEAVEISAVAGAAKAHRLTAAATVVEAKTFAAQGPPVTESWTRAAGSATLWKSSPL